MNYEVGKVLKINNAEWGSKKDSYYVVLLDNEELGIWSKELMKEYQDEAVEFKNLGNHMAAFCDECISGEYCKYADDTSVLSKELLSDKLNLPIFSISELTKKLDRHVY